MLHMDDTLDVEDVVTIFDELEVQNLVKLVLVETSLSQSFVVNERPTTSFPPAPCYGHLRMRTKTEQQTRTRLCSCARFY